jgi:hypothetical protein
MSHPRITVISVSWRSAGFLRDLFARLLALAEQPDTIRLLVADNTGGHDAELSTLDCPDLTILPIDVNRESMSIAHAIGLNALLPHVDTPYVLVCDPDIAVLYTGWDTALSEVVERQGIVAAGAPYPGWKLGKYHDFPSPPFAFWRADALKSLGPDWRPYGRTGRRRFADFVLRQAFWIPRVIDRYMLRLPRRQFRVGRWTERLVGIASKDTGWEIADRARRRGWSAYLFEVVHTPNSLTALPASQREDYRALAQEFELYAWEGRPFVTHRNPTRTQINFNLWTDNNILIYQNQADKALQTARWRELVATVLPAKGSG